MKASFLLIVLLLFSCSPKIVSYVNSSSSFESYNTYRLVSARLDSKNVAPENTLVFDLIKEKIKDEMNVRGYVLSNVLPDLTMRYEIASSTRVESNNSGIMNPYGPPMSFSSRMIYESVLLIELFNSQKKLVWQGSYDLGQERKEKRIERAIEKAVGYIFTTYPYKAGSSREYEELKSYEPKKKEK